MADFSWSAYQQAVFDLISDRSPTAPHIAVRARAGSGKTKTGVAGLDLTDRSSSVIACAFNADIARTLSARVPEHADARTFHSVGLAACRAALGPSVKVDKDKLRGMVARLCPDDPASYRNALIRVVSLAKSTLAPFTPHALGKIATYYHLDGAPDPWTPARARFDQDAATLARRSIEDLSSIDFDDMCYLPATDSTFRVRPYDFVLADEAQDLNACQHALVRKLLGRSGRLCAIGDDRQAIYQFRGAAEGAFDALANEFDAEILSLPICYRCDSSIVELARTVVPDLEARPDAPEGKLGDCSDQDLTPRPGDFVLSRTKAPLMGHCLRLLADGVPATIVGRDIAGGLQAMIRKSKAASCEALDRWTRTHEQQAFEKLAERDPEAYEEIADRCACLRVLAADAPSIGGLTAKIERLFSDGATGGQVRLSTTHKAKGLEAPHVWMLADTYRKRPGIAEENLWYVAVTRAEHELTMVWKDMDQKGEKANGA